MIRSVHHLAVVAVAMLFCIAVLSNREDWAIIPLLVLIPGDKIGRLVYESVEEWFDYRRVKKEQKELVRIQQN